MRSSFSRGRRAIKATARPQADENYDLKGLNLVAPDQVIPEGETPFTINSRRYADNEDETSVAIRTRRGSTLLSKAVGEAVNVEETGTLTGDITLGPTDYVAIPFTASADGSLTRFDAYVKRDNGTTGYLIADIYTNSDTDLPGQRLGVSSIKPSLIILTYDYVPAYFMDCPEMENGETYWAVFRRQDLSEGNYYFGKVATGLVHTSTDQGATWVAQTYKARFKAYTATTGSVLGFTKRYLEDTADNRTMFAFLGDIYEMPNSPAEATVLDAAVVDPTATYVRFFHVDQWSFWVDGVNAPRWYNGTTSEAVPNVPTANGPQINGMIFENRALWVPRDDPTRIDFSALYDFDSYPSVNFLYIGRPNSPDPITAMHEFKDAAVIFTRETKFTLTGTDIETFTPIPHVGSKGAISQEATAVGKEAIYFMADDRNIYAWNGTNDILLSRKILPELRKILDTSKVRLHLYENQLRIYYNRNPDSEISHMLLFDIEDGQWWHDTGRKVRGSMEWNFDNNELVEVSSKCAWFFYGEDGYSDLGKPINFKYWTAYKPYGSGAAKDRIKRFRPVVRPAESAYYLNVGKDIDFRNLPDMRPWLVDAGGAQWGSFNWGDGTLYGSSSLVDNVAAMSGRGKHTQFRFEHEGIDQPVQLLGYIALIKSGRPR